MISRAHWEDKRPEDKVAYYNRTRMSLEFFCLQMHISSMALMRDMAEAGYRYSSSERKFVKGSPSARFGLMQRLRSSEVANNSTHNVQ